jgi:phage-related minor tail protein
MENLETILTWFGEIVAKIVALLQDVWAFGKEKKNELENLPEEE